MSIITSPKGITVTDNIVTNTSGKNCFAITNVKAQKYMFETKATQIARNAKIEIGVINDSKGFDLISPSTCSVQKGDNFTVTVDMIKKKIVFYLNTDQQAEKKIKEGESAVFQISGKTTFAVNLGTETFMMPNADFSPVVVPNEKYEQLFLQLAKCDDGKNIGLAGLMKLTEECGLQKFEYFPFVLYAELSPSFPHYYVTQTSFVNFLASHQISSFAEFVPLAAQWKKDIDASETAATKVFVAMFQFTNLFEYSSCDDAHTKIKTPLKMSDALLLIKSFPTKWKHYNTYIKFLEEKRESEDPNNPVMTFAAFTYHPMLYHTYSNYDDYSDAAPNLIDEFAEWHKDRH